MSTINRYRLAQVLYTDRGFVQNSLQMQFDRTLKALLNVAHTGFTHPLRKQVWTQLAPLALIQLTKCQCQQFSNQFLSSFSDSEIDALLSEHNSNGAISGLSYKLALTMSVSQRIDNIRKNVTKEATTITNTLIPQMITILQSHSLIFPTQTSA